MGSRIRTIRNVGPDANRRSAYGGSETIPLEPGAVHVWWAWLGGPDARVAGFHRGLSVDERDRAARFRRADDRALFILSRGILRDILARYTGLPADEHSFSYGRYGKPALAGAARSSGLSFSLSHSGHGAIYAVFRGRAVGVDVEAIRPVPDAADIAAAFLARGATRTLEALPPQYRARAFLKGWVRFEAVVKAAGGTLWGRGGRVDLLNARDTLSVFVPSGNGAEPTSHVRELALGPNHVGAVATVGRAPVRVVMFDWLSECATYETGCEAGDLNGGGPLPNDA